MGTAIINPITKTLIEESYTYEAYNQKIEQLFSDGRTTNDDNSESKLGYTKLNISRVNRWDNKAVLIDETISTISKIDRKLTWLVISEGWCGDSAQILPFINKMSELNENIDLRVIFRDEHPQVMDQFLTNGVSRSIPIIAILDSETLEILGKWGPRPIDVHQRYLEERKNPEIGGKEASKNLHLWYARDKGRTIQEEFLKALNYSLS
jgi:hypothetical protein